MSVTLKMADEDAKFIGNILVDVAKLQEAVLRNTETAQQLKALERTAAGAQSINRILQLAGAFQVAVRANER